MRGRVMVSRLMETLLSILSRGDTGLLREIMAYLPRFYLILLSLISKGFNIIVKQLPQPKHNRFLFDGLDQDFDRVELVNYMFDIHLGNENFVRYAFSATSRHPNVHVLCYLKDTTNFFSSSCNCEEFHLSLVANKNPVLLSEFKSYYLAGLLDDPEKGKYLWNNPDVLIAAIGTTIEWWRYVHNEHGNLSIKLDSTLLLHAIEKKSQEFFLFFLLTERILCKPSKVHDLLMMSLRHGFFEIIPSIVDCFPTFAIEEPHLIQAARHGNPSIFRYLETIFLQTDTADNIPWAELFVYAIMSGNLAMVQDLWLQRGNLNLRLATTVAATYGRTAVMKYLLSNYAPIDTRCVLRAIDVAIATANPELLLLLIDHIMRSPNHLVRGPVPLMRDPAHPNRPILSHTLILHYCAHKGSLEMMKLLKGYGLPWNMYTTREILKRTNLPMLEYCVLHEDPCPIYEKDRQKFLPIEIHQFLVEHEAKLCIVQSKAVLSDSGDEPSEDESSEEEDANDDGDEDANGDGDEDANDDGEDGDDELNEC